MNLCSSIVANRLQGQFVFTIYGKIDEVFQLKRPVLAAKSTVYEHGCVYVHVSGNNSLFSRSSLPSLRLHSLLLTDLILTDEDRDCFDCVFCFHSGTDMAAVFNNVQQTFNLYDEWIENLERLCRSGAMLTELLDCSRDIFVNPLLIHGADFKFIAYSSFIDESDAYTYLITDENKDDILNSFMELASFRDTFSVSDAALFPSIATNVRTIYKNIFDQNKLLLRILVAEVVRPLAASDIPLMEILSQYVQFSVMQSQPENERALYTLDSVFYALLDHQNIDEYQFNRTLTAYGWTPDKTYLCAKFIVDKLDIQNHTAKALISSLRQLVKNSCIFEFQSNIVMFANLGDDDSGAEDTVHSTIEFIRDNNLKAGFSNPYSGFMHIYQLLYVQAENALEIGRRYMPFKWVHHFRDIADKYLLEKCTNELPANMLCAPEILHLYNYDETHHSEYYHTLKTYLENNMQPVLTAKKLYIHRTTLLYRLEKMASLFRINLSDPNRRFFYQLSMLLLEQMNLHNDTEY